MRIDIHAHSMQREYLERLTRLLSLSVVQAGNGLTLLRRGSTTLTVYREDMFETSARLGKMDEQGVDMRVLSLSSPHVYDWPVPEQAAIARMVNDDTAKLVEAHPDRFRAFAAIPLGNTADALSELSRCLDELGMIGVGIGSNVAGKPLDHPDLEEFWAEVNRRKVPVFEHPVTPLGADHMDAYELPVRVGFVYETTTAMTRLLYSGVLERYGDFPLIVAHTGGALLSLLERLDVGYRIFPDCRANISKSPSETAKRLYFDTCSYYPPMIKMALDIVGPDRLLWGSDDPFLSAPPSYLENMDITPADKAKIMSGNAKRILSLG